MLILWHRWSGSFDSSAVETAVDELTKSVVDEWITNLWYSAITSDQEAPKELHILIKGVIAEIAQRTKHVNLITLLSRLVSCRIMKLLTLIYPFSGSAEKG